MNTLAEIHFDNYENNTFALEQKVHLKKRAIRPFIKI